MSEPNFTPQDYNEFVDGAELDGVDVLHLEATRHLPGEADNVTFELEGGFTPESGRVFYQFTLSARATQDTADSDEPDTLAEAKVSLHVRFTTPHQPVPEILERFGRSTAMVVAQPYLREHIAALTTRLGVAGVLLPLQKFSPQRSASE